MPKPRPAVQRQTEVAPRAAVGGYNPNPQLVAAIKATVPPEYQAAALATALVESGGRLDAVGDSGNSFGPYQMNRRGRLAATGYTPQQAQDPRLATQAFWNETKALTAKYPGIDWAELMYRSQRPADRAGYIAKLRQVEPVARQLLGGGGAPARAPSLAQGMAEQPVGGGLSGGVLQSLISYATQLTQGAQRGEAPDISEAFRLIAPLMAARGGPRPSPSSGGPDEYGPPMNAGSLVKPLATPMGASAFGSVDAEGAPDRSGTKHHAAVDWFAPAGSTVRSPASGQVVEVKTSRGNSGQVFGGTVKVQDPSGRVFVFRHVDPRGVRVGQRVDAGTPLAAVSAWTGGAPHAHIEIWKTLAGGYNYENMVDPATVFGRA